MKFFIDTANLEQIREANDLGILDGVTTNPSLMAKEGISGNEAILQHYKDICDIVNGDISAEVLSTTYEEMIAEGETLAKIHPNIVVKIPMTKDGVKALKYFSDKGIKTNCTLIFSVGQALLAAKAGATYVSPFLGRLDDISTDSLNLIEEIRLIFDNYNYDSYGDNVIEIDEIDNDYNPVWEIVIDYDDNLSVVEERVAEILDIHSNELKRVYEEIKDKESEYKND